MMKGIHIFNASEDACVTLLWRILFYYFIGNADQGLFSLFS